MFSSDSSLKLPKTLPESHQRLLRLPNTTHASWRDLEISLGSATPFRRRIAQTRRDKTLFVKSLQCGVDRPERNGSPRLLLDLTRYRHTICVLAEPYDHQHDHKLKFTEVESLRHFFDYSEEIDCVH